MLGLPIAFAVPGALIALALLPALWWLLRLTPPRPREIPFPPLRLILDLQPRDETPAHTPWWLLLLRLVLAAAVILAMAGPVWNPLPAAAGSGPLVLVVDDGWPAAPDWARREDFVLAQSTSAQRAGRSVVLAPVSKGAISLAPLDPASARDVIRALKPQPYVPNRAAALPALRAYAQAHPDAQFEWISDGLAQSDGRSFGSALAALAPGRVRAYVDERSSAALSGATNGADGLDVRVLRPDARAPARGVVRALDRRGLEIGRTGYDFGAADIARARFVLPVELRNDVARLEIVGERSAGAVQLLDSRSRRRRVAIASAESADLAEPYVAPDYFLEKALSPYADIARARPGSLDPISDLIAQSPAMVILADFGRITGPAHDRLEAWVRGGGTLVRFAGTRLAESADDLIPVRLRQGGRVLGGALSWDRPKQLAPFDHASPFFGLDVTPEVTVKRQVLAEPDADLPEKTWATLADGTPLVTAERRGRGLIVLFHVTADTSWSNLPLSGLFVDMLRRIEALSVQPAATGAPTQAAAQGIAPTTTRAAAAAPVSTLDGFGALGPPPPTARPIPAGFAGEAGPDHPPGFYGPADGAVAVNALGPKEALRPLDLRGLGLAVSSLRPAQAVDLRAPLLVAAFILLLIDALATFWLSGGLAGWRRPATLAAVAFAAASMIALAAPRADAQEGLSSIPKADIEAALQTRLAYVVTGDAAVDAESKAGLESLSEALKARTSFVPGPPAGVDPARDELVFYPMLYWPIAPDRPQPSAPAIAKIAAYMKEGGLIVFDTRDALESRPGGPPTPETMWLRKLLAGVDVPELEPVPRDHVVTKTFYLLDGFVGRTTVGQTWIQALPPPPPDAPVARPARAGDGVSPIIITSNDLAAAWATTPEGDPMYPLIPGGERQRELAIRGGINLAMYALTGNYKADQVHVRDLLERLSH